MTVIAIDGPAGSGKSTVARRLADRLDLDYLDTGAMYRALTVAVLDRGVYPADQDAVGALAVGLELALTSDAVVADGADVTAAIREPRVTTAVSSVAANPKVRTEMVARQRAWVSDHGGGVVEGRDIGTVVFPDATLKVYLTARPEVRARRRAGELRASDTAEVQADLARRDNADYRRDASPLRVADGATTLDTSDRDVEAIVAEVLGMLESVR